MSIPARAFTRTTVGDFYAPANTGTGAFGRVTGARLTTAAAAGTAQIVDANSNILYNLCATAGFADECDLVVQFEGKVSLGTVTGAGVQVTVYVE